MTTEDALADPEACAQDLRRLMADRGIDPSATPAWPVWRTFVDYLMLPVDADHDAAACSADRDPELPGMHRLCLHRLLVTARHGRQHYWGVRCRLRCTEPPRWSQSGLRIDSFGCTSFEEFAEAVEAHPVIAVLFRVPTWQLDVAAGSPPPDW